MRSDIFGTVVINGLLLGAILDGHQKKRASIAENLRARLDFFESCQHAV